MNTREVVIALPGSIDNVAQTVEDSRAFAQGKKLVERHPFLTGRLGPSIARKLFGRRREKGSVWGG